MTTRLVWLVELEQQVVARIAGLAVDGRPFQLTGSLAHRAVPVQDEAGEFAVMPGLVDPLPGELHLVLDVLLAGDGFRFEARKWGSRRNFSSW